MEFLLEAKTDIWTGGMTAKEQLRLTSIKGAIRWWTEALLRGFGAYVCDPTDDKEQEKRCLLDMVNQDKKSAAFEKEVKKKICPGCYLFGCTGWSGKIGLRIREAKLLGSLKSTQIKEKEVFSLELLPLKPIEEIEQDLLTAAIRLIVDYGSIGGRTTLKPSEEEAKNKKGHNSWSHHADYGILGRHFEKNADISRLPAKPCLSQEAVKLYLTDFEQTRSRQNNDKWPDLACFWFLRNETIDRKTHNELVNRDTDKYGSYLKSTPGFEFGFHDWLGGEIEKPNPSNSKKIFSFYSVKRSWGYTKSDGKMYSRFLAMLEDKYDITKIICGTEVIRNEL